MKQSLGANLLEHMVFLLFHSDPSVPSCEETTEKIMSSYFMPKLGPK